MSSTSKLKTSQSSIDFGHHEPSEPLQRSNSVKSTHSQPDLLHLTEATDSNHFYEELLEEFDQHSSLENHPGNGNHVTGSGTTGNGSGEENNSGNLDMIEENMSTKSNDRALQIIQENSSILETLLSKKVRRQFSKFLVLSDLDLICRPCSRLKDILLLKKRK